jgi:TetR/AcrR family transcriptional regulator, mexJK operon transcriptional repressor
VNGTDVNRVTEEVPEAQSGRQIADEPAFGGRPDKQAAILEAATRVFLREGYEGASVDTIAAEAGVSKRTVYNHFGDKRELFLATMERVRARSEIDAALDLSLFSPGGDLRENVIAFGEGLLRGFLKPECSAFRRVLIAELSRHPELKKANLDGPTPKRIQTWLTDRIVEANAQGRLEAPNPGLAANQYLALLFHECTMESNFGTDPVSDETIHEIAVNTGDLLLRAYAPRP